MFGFRRTGRVKFVAAGPSLVDRLGHALRRGRILWIVMLPWILITAPLRILGNGLYAVFVGGRLAEEAVQSRQIRHLVLGAPSILATLGVLVIAGVILGRQYDLNKVYSKAATEAFRVQDYAKARLYFERLFQLDKGSAETRYYLGCALDELGKESAAMQMIGAVAQGQAGGYARANAWVAKKLLADEEARRNPEVRATIYRNLVKAHQGLPGNVEVLLNLVNYHMLTGDYRKAIPYLEKAAEVNPVLNLKLAGYYSLDRHLESARTVLNRAENYLRGQLEHDPLDQRTRFLLTKSLTLQGEFRKALEVLETGQALNPSTTYRRLIAEVHVAIHDQLLREGDRDPGQLLQHLREALRYNPGMKGAIKRLVNFGEISRADGNGSADSQAAASAKELLRSMLARGENLVAVHMALGLKAWRDQDFENARRHFQAAYELDPSRVYVANNLAWTLTHQKRSQPKRALEIINTVLARHPENPRFRDTRGEAYLALEQWDRAIADLEFALPALENESRIHLSLAKAYAARGQSKLAAAHRLEAHRLEAQRLTKDKDTQTQGRSEGKDE